MFARLAAVSVALICMLTDCSGVGKHEASPQVSANAQGAGASPWGCGDPQPGHPTPAEQRAFVDEVGALATAAEARYGVPAAAITGMAILESGYGWTRLAQNTNNLLAWKYFPGVSPAERDTWVLECPALGTSDQFLVFRDRTEAVDFVAAQLASTDNYRADTEQYQRDRASGVDVVEAVNRWVDGIADPYSSQPAAYRTAVRRVMKDTYEPGDGRSAEGNLYDLSRSVSPPQA